MNKAMLTIGIILLSLIALVMINVISNYSTGQDLDYYLLRETTEAAMEDAVDVGYYRRSCQLRIDKEKFAENFLCRFANAIDNTRTYRVGFYDMSEIPPKVSVKVDSNTAASFQNQQLAISTTVDVIMETNYTDDPYCAKKIAKERK